MVNIYLKKFEVTLNGVLCVFVDLLVLQDSPQKSLVIFIFNFFFFYFNESCKHKIDQCLV